MGRLRIDRLRELREEKGWSIKDLAQILKCEVSTPARWEHGQLQPRRRTVEQLAEIFNVNVSELIEDDST